MQQQALPLAEKQFDFGSRTLVRVVKENIFIFIPVYSSSKTFSEAGVSTLFGVASGSKSLFSPHFFINRLAKCFTDYDATNVY